uniref:Uncharacterized protein n=1 Tax=Utricularia reniformis TaxID=192314 RepID=A0A1Y0B4B7_9LAMI|nr:hypothetical protein AEK19_MT2079 [Utricularia reniformis]ART32234.1 hypothetical protein AEK19_MT2079 [Utricularia reniformis]
MSASLVDRETSYFAISLLFESFLSSIPLFLDSKGPSLVLSSRILSSCFRGPNATPYSTFFQKERGLFHSAFG